LPYDVIAGVVPCPKGWLVVSARLVSTVLSFEPPQVIRDFVDVVDYRPTFTVIAVHAPLGLLEKATPGGRTCDREARRLLGPRRGAAIATPPSRAGLADPGSEPLAAVVRQLLPRYTEVTAEMAPYRQRQLYEVHPEVSFYQLNGDRPLKYPKRMRAGMEERLALLEDRMGGMDSVLSAGLPGIKTQHLLDAGACLWTARRIKARAVSRLPEDPEWDEQSLLMQILR